MTIHGNLRKMKTEFADPVRYFIAAGETEICMNELLGHEISLEFMNRINCIHCGKVTKTSFGQGFCYPCFQTAPEADPAITSPELDMAHLGISRDMEWAKENSLVDHFVYLANSGGMKVGVTRHTQVPTRWIDQGASEAVIIARTPYRNLAGQIEVALKKHFADKTNWRKMLTGSSDGFSFLEDEKARALNLLPEELKQFAVAENDLRKINYPVRSYPAKVNSVSFDKTALVKGKLNGIKGQYLIFENGDVFNVRKHSGYFAEMKF